MNLDFKCIADEDGKPRCEEQCPVCYKLEKHPDKKLMKPIKIKSDFEVPIDFKNINEGIIESVNNQMKKSYENGFKDGFDFAMNNITNVTQ